MESNLDPALRQAYLETDYIISDDPPTLLRIGEYNPDVRILLASFGVDSGAFITAWNPGSTRLPDEENDERQSLLLDEIEHRRLNYFIGYGERADWREYSYFVLGINREDAIMLASQFHQHAFVWLGDDGIPELVSLV
jgi:hypothetical protein